VSAPLLNLSRVKAALAGRPVVVLGSAILKAPLEPQTEAALVAVNGGISSGWRDPDIWVLNARCRSLHTWQQVRKSLHLLMVKQGAGRAVPLVVLLSREDGSAEHTLERLERQGTVVTAALDVNQTDRHEIELAACSRRKEAAKHAFSAGLFATCLSLICTDQPITLAGFSWHAGYEYLHEPGITQRGHEAGDKFALHVLEREYPGRVIHTLPLPANPLGRTMSVRPYLDRRTHMAKTPGIQAPIPGAPGSSPSRPRAPRAPRTPAAPVNPPLAPPAPRGTLPPVIPPTGQPLRPRTLGGPTARVSTEESRRAARTARTAAQAAGRPILDRAASPEAVQARHDALNDAYNEHRGKVRAKKLLFYDMARRREGDVFILREPTDFKASQMEWVSASTPTRTTTPSEAAVRRDRGIAGQGQPRRLKPNAADYEDDDDKDTRSPLDE